MIRERAFLHRYGATLACLLLAVITLITFWNVQSFDFVFDDGLYIGNNRHLSNGLTTESLRWAFKATEGGNWHPLTWLSLLGDSSLYGSNAGGYHWTNLLFHIANTLLLFLVLNRMTGAFYSSAFVAALFAVHPLHVESVAWIAERKDVLSTFFWMLTLWFYSRYAERPAAFEYCLVLCFFILGLLSKPMLVTVPLQLLALDYWPLQRFCPSGEKNRAARLLLEKAPLLFISITIGLVTLYTQQTAGALQPLTSASLSLRTMNALSAYVGYIKKMFWPQGLAVFYPYSADLPMSQVFLSGLLLLIISLFVIRNRKEHPYLATGWAWYIVTLLPVIGIIQVGRQAMADRYTYVPLIGLFIMLAWGIPELLRPWRHKTTGIPALATAIILVFAIASRIQSQVWENSITLFTHARNVTAGNYLAEGNLGVALAARRDNEGAIYHYREALRIKPDFVIARTNLGAALVKRGQSEEAIEHFRAALAINPHYGSALRQLADELLKKDVLEEAAALYQRALLKDPDNPELYNNLGIASARQGQLKLAEQYFQSALRINPSYAEARKNLSLIRKKIKQ